MIVSKRRVLLAAGATVAIGVLVRKPWASAGSSGLSFGGLGEAGEAVPPFTFETADGATRSLADYAGKGVVLNFWATWCVPCVKEMPSLAELAGLLKGTEVVVLPLSSDRGGADKVEQFYRERSIAGLPVLLDRQGAAARAFGARGIPTTVLIDAHGRERGRVEGAADWTDASAVGAAKALGSRT